MKDLRGVNAILTGASRGLGVVIARTLAREGVNLALAARSAEDLERVRKEVEDIGVKAVVIPTDVSDTAQLDALVDRATAELGPPDILVNNAGIEVMKAYHEYPPSEIDAVVRINLLAPMLLTRRVLPGMLERGRGHVVNMASLAGKGGFPCEAPYATTKAGLVMFTHTLRAELIDTPVGCSVVCPGFVADEGMYARMAEEGHGAPRVLGATTPQKVADAVVKAIKRGSVELLVNPSPMRPLLTLSQAFPDVSARVLKILGVTDYARRVAREREGGRV